MSANPERPTAPRRDPRASDATSGELRPRRTLWTAIRRLLWTSTVASACTTTRVQTAPVPEPLPSGKGGEIRLSLRSGEIVSMYDARLVQDSIIGQDQPAASPNRTRLAVARNDVQSVATKKVSIGKTILAAVGGVVATFSFLLLAACVSLAVS